MQIAIGIFFLLFGIGLAYMLWRLAGMLVEVTGMIRDVNHEAVPILTRVQTTVDEVNANLGNVDDITEHVAAMTGTLENTTSTVSGAVTGPVKKVAGFTAGVSEGLSTFVKGWRKES
jgi:hypothetical protein